MLKKVKKPDLHTIDDFDAWFFDEIEPLNKLIENAVEVTGKEVSGMDWYFKKNTFEEDMTHRGWVISVQPIKQETCADILKRYFKLKQDGLFYDLEEDWERKAKAALERESE